MRCKRFPRPSLRLRFGRSRRCGPVVGDARIQCVDIDLQALTATVSNAEVNGVESNIRVSQKPAELEPAELVLANILGSAGACAAAELTKSEEPSFYRAYWRRRPKNS